MSNGIAALQRLADQFSAQVHPGVNHVIFPVMLHPVHISQIFQKLWESAVIGYCGNLQRAVALLLKLFCQLFNPAAGHQLSFHKNAYSVADLLHLIKLVGGNQNGPPFFFRHLTDQRHQFPHSFRVKSQRRFIHDDHLRVLDQHIRHAETLLHTTGIGSCLLIRRSGHSHFFQKNINPLLQLFAAEAVQSSGKPQIFPSRHIHIKANAVRQITHDLFYRNGVPRTVFSINKRGSRRGLSQPKKHQRGRGFARAVWAKQAEDLALFNVQRQIVDRFLFSVGFGQTLHLYDHFIV